MVQVYTVKWGTNPSQAPGTVMSSGGTSGKPVSLTISIMIVLYIRNFSQPVREFLVTKDEEETDPEKAEGVTRYPDPDPNHC